MRHLALVFLALAPLVAQDHVDLGVVDRIKAEAFDHSKVMDHLYYLTDVYGGRLTASPEFEQAANWASSRLKEYGVANVHTERWGPFGRSWSLKQASVEMIEPRYANLTAVPLAWSSSTPGPVTGELILAPIHDNLFQQGPAKTRAALEAYKKEWAGKLRGKIVLVNEPHVPKPLEKALFRRYSAEELADIAKSPTPVAKLDVKKVDELKWPEDPEDVEKFLNSLPENLEDEFFDLYEAFIADRGAFFAKEGAVAVLREDRRAHDGLAFAEAAGSFLAKDMMAAPTFVITAEQYNRIARTLQKGTPPQLRIALKADISDKDVDGWNIVGEIPGGSKKDEIVMVGAHFDSWHSGTGATDNGAGSAVMIEVMRILKTLNLPLDRTVRIGLWGGEEQGLFGSRAYVKEHFADPKTMKLTSQHAKLSGYFNLDNGSGKIRGVYLQGHEAMRPIFESWLAPFQDLGVTTLSIRNTGGTDHLSFNAVGLPGFQFIQDPLDYGTITHHSDMDTYDHAVPEDLMQAAAVITTVVYEAANRKEMLPRRPLPKPE